MKEPHIVRYSAAELARMGPGETDFARINVLTDADIEGAMRDDPDWADLIDFDWSKAVVTSLRRKKAVSIRLDEDVLAFFKAQGAGYQTRMNAVLRHYMAGVKKSDAAE